MQGFMILAIIDTEKDIFHKIHPKIVIFLQSLKLQYACIVQAC